MPLIMSNVEIAEALENCAAEPVHIPGIVQPFGAILAVDPKTSVVAYASGNTLSILGVEYADLLGCALTDVFGHDLWHALNNMLARPSCDTKTTSLGDFPINGGICHVGAFVSDGLAVLEIEPLTGAKTPDPEPLKTIRFFMDSVEGCETEDALFHQTTELLRHLTGYHRVMVYRFDQDFNGQVISDNHRSDMDSFDGMRFPHWDIPKQARAMMIKTPLRFIADVDQVPVPLYALDADLAPLDMSYAYARGVSAVHMEYLRNMGSAATMTLSVILNGDLWGIISFHHKKPRLPAPALREIMVHIGQIFSAKLNIIKQKQRLDLVSRVDALKDQMLLDGDDEAGSRSSMKSILQVLNADGLIIVQSDIAKSMGNLPDDNVIRQLKSAARSDGSVIGINSLAGDLSVPDKALNGCAGALVFAPDAQHCLMVFRRETEQEISWAGNPEKTIEKHDGKARLSPRGSFSTYLEQVRGTATPWSEQDLYFAGRIWVLINTIQRRELIETLNRQQKIMIHELNHRVRNILALVRSVSQQAKQSSYGSLTSYSRSLEARIQALAASHELASSSVVSVVGVSELITREFQPFKSTGGDRFTITGTGQPLRAEIAPIFSLVIHELVTNAVKYGALSNDAGSVGVILREDNNGLEVIWREVAGPQIVPPKVLGFGSTLIKQAIPYELDGEASLEFSGDGVTARFFLPKKLFNDKLASLPVEDHSAPTATVDDDALRRVLQSSQGLLVEDNYVIAAAAQDELHTIGLARCETAANVEQALDFLEAVTPSFAILDVNLGLDETSFPIAQKLLERGIPFFFVTGYGDSHQTPVAFKSTMRLTKPLPQETLKSALTELLENAF